MSRIPSPYGRVVPAGTTTRFEQHASPLSLGSTASPRFGNKRPSAQSSPSNNGSRPNANSPGSVIKSYNSPGNGEVGTLRKEMGRAVGLKLEDVDTADVEKLRAAAANAIKLHRRLQEVEIERANELRDLQAMMSSLQQKEEELTEFVASVQKRRQETDPYEKAQVEIAELQEELKKALDQSEMDAEHRRLREESSNLRDLFKRIETAVQKVQFASRAAYVGTDDELQALNDAETDKGLDKVEITKLAEEMLAETEGLKVQLNAETNKRKKLHNQLVNLRGAIRVFARVRPMLDAAGQQIEGEISTDVDEGTDTISVNGARANAHRPQDVKERKYGFDRVFAMSSTQESIYDEASAVVTSVMDGYNVCIFAYGQTGSGKTYTMEGLDSNRGVNHRTLKELFEIAHLRRSQMEYTFKVSLLEVYNEEIRDLLDEYVPEVTWTTHRKLSSRPHLDLRVLPDGCVDIPGLITTEVGSLDAAWGILQQASRVRSSGETKSNEHSSRSHCLLRVSVHGYNKLNKDEMSAKLWLVDLAGSERVGKSEAQGQRLKEAQFINRSLSALGDCIYALSTKSSHVPFRNSKLTHMLADSLGGDSKTVMFVHVSPNLYDVGETTCSLNFASRVRGVEMGPAKRHVESNASEVQKAKMQVTDLKAQVEELLETKLAQQKKIRDSVAEQDSLRDAVQKAAKANAKLQRRIEKLQAKLGAAALEEEVECEEETEDDVVIRHSADPFLAPTAHPLFKPADDSCIISSTPRYQPSQDLGEALKVRTTEGGSLAVKNITVFATAESVKVTLPKSEAFRARFADFRTKPDRPETDEPDDDPEEISAGQKEKKVGLLRRKWVGFF